MKFLVLLGLSLASCTLEVRIDDRIVPDAAPRGDALPPSSDAETPRIDAALGTPDATPTPDARRFSDATPPP